MRYPLSTTQPSLWPSLLLTGRGHFKSKTSRRAKGKGGASAPAVLEKGVKRGDSPGSGISIHKSGQLYQSRRSWHCFWGQEA